MFQDRIVLIPSLNKIKEHMNTYQWVSYKMTLFFTDIL